MKGSGQISGNSRLNVDSPFGEGKPAQDSYMICLWKVYHEVLLHKKMQGIYTCQPFHNHLSWRIGSQSPEIVHIDDTNQENPPDFAKPGQSIFQQVGICLIPKTSSRSAHRKDSLMLYHYDIWLHRMHRKKIARPPNIFARLKTYSQC